MSTMTMAEQEQEMEVNRLMIMVERLQQAGHDERQIKAAVAGAARPTRDGWASRLRLLRRASVR